MNLTIPLTPPSANHYKVPIWNRRRFYITKEARDYKDAVALHWSLSGSPQVNSERLQATLRIYLGKGERLDAGNAEKCAMDALQECGAIRNDSDVKRLVVEIHRDRDNPRTEITVEAL